VRSANRSVLSKSNPDNSVVTNTGIIFRMVTLVLQGALVLALFFAGQLVYRNLPAQSTKPTAERPSDTQIQLIMRPAAQMANVALDVPVEFSPVDIVAVHNEYFTERRAGKRFDDFLTERMNGRRPVAARLDRSGRAILALPSGNWWVHAALTGDEDLEWRLPVRISGANQTIELTPQNAYTRTKTF
jgi:hypothetical protein